ncbi:MAG: General secretion pathway protein E [candidate division CPR1 bacterium GW2011_GWC1_49_13]|uniref:General secretion pathway protein E n=1 Tax=candidate division CPR1 bacterium GW2011_GWC1_49_13 TaxID=1618342 RepID=A0A0G1YHC3_9BACT|nr:MAG: General secretion pathway protein E [candidate division CPR1 bacterium GW2011_GWC1_49_13]
MVTRIKVLAGLRTDEHFAAQDGKLSFRTGIDLPKERQEKMDVRVSIVPTTHGEKVVMRLLSARVRQYSLEDMGFSETDLKRLKEAYIKPYGMIIASGPTGSGKTTTMYAVLKILNKRDINITTIEDPVEYDMEGVNQIQVNQKTGLTFALGLRSIVLIRLLDMGVEPFLVASSVNVVVAQRLVRVLCPQCKKEKQLATAELYKNFPPDFVKKHLGSGAKVKVFEAQGCSVCQNTGYTDRIGIHEVMLIDDEIRQAVIDRKAADTIEEMSIKKGMISMLEDGFIKVGKGITTIEELLRVVKE